MTNPDALTHPDAFSFLVPEYLSVPPKQVRQVRQCVSAIRIEHLHDSMPMPSPLLSVDDHHATMGGPTGRTHWEGPQP